MPKILSSIACNLDNHILLASLALFESEKVQAIEWSFDTLFNFTDIPPWFTELLHAFSAENRLIGHGVFFSLFSGKWSKEQQNWLNHLKKLSSEYHFDHITEHFGFMTGADFHKGAPLSIPFNNSTLAIGQDRLKRIYEACQCPVGLENLAFSYSLEEVKRHGAFLTQLIEPVNGFIILDLHNLYCQIHNFDMPFEEIIRLYPLERVREIHISGGSWENSDLRLNKKIRRDTHDEAVPNAVFDLLKRTMPLCPNLKFVVLEQLGNGLTTEESRRLFQKDFFMMDEIVEKQNDIGFKEATNTFLPPPFALLNEPIEDNLLAEQQRQLSTILETAVDYEDAKTRLNASNLADSDWKIENWQPYMLETAVRIAQKWKSGF
jgi:uncharacterized protein (UPF0276 family)